MLKKKYSDELPKRRSGDSRDAFFTKPELARKTWATAIKHAKRTGVPPKTLSWVEPSAGAGVFVKERPKFVTDDRIHAFDIEPLDESVKKKNWLKTIKDDMPAVPFAVIGNPPFGRQGALVSQFVNQAFYLGAEFCCMISPGVMMRKYGQRGLRVPIGIADNVPFDARDAFVLPNGRIYRINATYQIIVYARHGIRSRGMPHHPDFKFVGKSRNGSKEDAIKRIKAGGYARLFIAGLNHKGITMLSEQEAIAIVHRYDNSPITFIYPRGGIDYRKLRERIDGMDFIKCQEMERASGNNLGSIGRGIFTEHYAELYGWGQPDTQMDILPAMGVSQ